MSDKKVEPGQRYQYLPTDEVFVVVKERTEIKFSKEWFLRPEADPEQQAFDTEENLLHGRYKLLPRRAP